MVPRSWLLMSSSSRSTAGKHYEHLRFAMTQMRLGINTFLFACPFRNEHARFFPQFNGTSGKDHIDWVSIAAALHKIHYQGDIVIESFSGENKALARAASLWRPIERTRSKIAVEGVTFLRNLLSNRSAGSDSPRGASGNEASAPVSSRKRTKGDDFDRITN